MENFRSMQNFGTVTYGYILVYIPHISESKFLIDIGSPQVGTLVSY